jgi:hypothetical protein
MIYGPQFAWAHLMRTAGDATRVLFEAFPDLVTYTGPTGRVVKHVTFAEAAVRRPLMVLGFRQLPAWLLSRAVLVARVVLLDAKVPIDRRRLVMPDRDEVIETANIADQQLDKYTDHGRIGIDIWLRAEYLRADFLAFILLLRPVTREEIHHVMTADVKGPLHYDHDTDAFFGPGGIAEIYRRNPGWAALEYEIYGRH